MTTPRYHPGELLETVLIKRETPTPDGMGGNTIAVNTVYTRRAHVRPLSGGERRDWDQVNATHMYLVVIRRIGDITEADRIEWRGVDFNIRAIADRGPRSLYLELTVERGVAQ